jgi:ribosomal protein S18 acetylase RimI-like enzyme
MSDVTVRLAEVHDVVEVARLLTDLNQTVGVGGYPPAREFDPELCNVTADELQRRAIVMRNLETIYVAEVAGAVCGFVSLRLTPYLDQDVPYAEITEVYVAAEARRHGVARALMLHAEAQAARSGATSVHLVTGADNHDAQAFYKAAGYEDLYVGFEKFLPAAYHGAPSHA